MPEGDTLHRLAAKLGPILQGATIESGHGREQGPLEVAEGARVAAVRAVGKNLLIELDNAWSVRVHLGIGGRCRLLAPDAPASGATMILRTTSHAVAFFDAARARLVRSAHLRATPALVRLGPDLLDESPDFDEILRRARAVGNRRRDLSDILLDQRIAAGIGNVYKCELLFLERLDPWRTAQEVDDAALRALFVRAHELMRRNVHTPGRVTRFEPGPRTWVYGRRGERCLRCEGRVEARRQGDQARITYFCPRCQPPRPT